MVFAAMGGIGRGRLCCQLTLLAHRRHFPPPRPRIETLKYPALEYTHRVERKQLPEMEGGVQRPLSRMLGALSERIETEAGFGMRKEVG